MAQDIYPLISLINHSPAPSSRKLMSEIILGNRNRCSLSKRPPMARGPKSPTEKCFLGSIFCLWIVLPCPEMFENADNSFRKEPFQWQFLSFPCVWDKWVFFTTEVHSLLVHTNNSGWTDRGVLIWIWCMWIMMTPRDHHRASQNTEPGATNWLEPYDWYLGQG